MLGPLDYHRYIGVLSYTFYCTFYAISEISLYRDRYIGVLLYHDPLRCGGLALSIYDPGESRSWSRTFPNSVVSPQKAMFKNIFHGNFSSCVFSFS